MPSTFTHYGYDYPNDGPHARMMAKFLPPPDPAYSGVWNLFRDWAKKHRADKDDMEAMLRAYDSGDMNVVLRGRPDSVRDLELIAVRLGIGRTASVVRVAHRFLEAWSTWDRSPMWPGWKVTLTKGEVRLSTRLDRWDSKVNGTSMDDEFDDIRNFEGKIVKAAGQVLKAKLEPILAGYGMVPATRGSAIWSGRRNIGPIGDSMRLYGVQVSFPFRHEGPPLLEIEKELQQALP